jgi:hypothetical protein
MRAVVVAVALATACGSASAQNLKTVTENSFGCVTEQAFDDARSYLFNREAKLLEREFAAGQCVALRKGQQVILVDVAFLSHAVVRIPDDPTKLYTFFTTIK